jgi:carbon storage regulator
MLVLSRKENEKLVIAGNIVITVVRIMGGGVRIGIEAPPEISVKREELLHRARAQQLRPSCEVSLPQHSAMCLAPVS